MVVASYREAVDQRARETAPVHVSGSFFCNEGV
jgi:hypothetical protein